MSIKNFLASLSLGLLAFATASASEEATTMKYPARFGVGVHIGFNLGGALPPSVPKPVKKVHAFRPGGAPNVGLDLSYRLSSTSPFSITTGVEYDTKFFQSTVRAEEMPIRYQNEDYREQIYSGYQSVEYGNRYLTVPLGVTFDMPKGDFRFFVGGYYGYALTRKFVAKLDGDGMMDGETYLAGAIVSTDLSHMLVRHDVGVRFGADYKIDRHWAITGRMNVGLPKLFDKSFNIMPYALRNVFLNLGVSYRINR